MNQLLSLLYHFLNLYLKIINKKLIIIFKKYNSICNKNIFINEIIKKIIKHRNFCVL
jgi:hypothetical protein